jgi:ribose transport system substrate-binding protein
MKNKKNSAEVQNKRRKVLMKKIMWIVLVAAVIVSVIATLSFTGCKTATTETTAEETTAAEETTQAEETTAADETVAEDMNEPDPWIQEKRDVEKPFIPADGQVRFSGVEGEVPEYDLDLVLTKAEVEQIKSMKLKGAYVDNNTAGEYSLAIIGGARETFEYLGIEMVAETSADFDSAKQKSDVETVLALDPDVIIGYPVDPTTGAEVFKPVVDAGKVLVCVSNRPKGYEMGIGKDFVAISTNNPYDNAYRIVEIMAEALPADAKVGIITFEDEYFVLNVMDQAFKDGIAELAPGWTVVEQGFVDWQQVGQIATAMVQKDPDIQAFYTTWFDPAMVAVQDLKAIERSDIQVYTFGMNTPACVDLLDPDGMVKGLTSDFTWNVGMNSAILCAYGILGKEAPQMLVVPTADVTADNLRDVWSMAYRNVPIPQEIEDALAAVGK